MLEAIRKSLRSKIGAGIAIAVLVLIALAFASGDVATTGGFGGIAGGDRVATVGDERIDTSALGQAASSALERVKQNDPRMTMKVFLASNGLERVLEDMIDRTAVAVFGKQNGLVASDRLVDSEITQIAAFKGADGKFSEDIFRQAIQQQGISEKLVRDDLTQGLVSKQVLLPAAFGSVVPRELAKRYAALLRDRRSGAMAVLPAALFAPEKAPTDAELAAYYKANQDNFIRPERRVVRYASFGDEALKDVPDPTDAEIAFRYDQDKDQYAALETRTVTQIIAPTEAAAKAIIAEVNGGKSLEDAAKAKGLATAKLDSLGRDALTKQFSQAVADAAYATGRGKLAAPARSGLGWHVMRVEEINSRPARTLDQVRGEIAERIATEKKRVALSELLSRIEDQFDEGGSLAEAAKELGVTLEQTPAITADGQVYENPREKAPEVLARVLETAFAMDQEEPQIAEVEPGKTFVVFDVTDIEPSAAAPLKEISDDVKASYMMDNGFAAARKAAEKVQGQVRKGEELGKALASLGKRLPPVQNLNMTREEMARMQMEAQRQVPPPLALFFSMAEGTVKLLAAPRDTGWFIVHLKDIVPGEVKDDDKILDTAERELGGVVGNEYVASMRRAIRAEVGIERNETAIKAVATQLSGGN
ncbi:MAG: peptidyl-prolyl cis-trans isomerase [Novosphingobium sp.]|nr:peptidyl-prolyl cis-trans isomerase [Novosphingobium sp.]MCP5402654.1 peptidyl-prolyl cis-trans isomerase [Novosphingobium sp.]